MESLQEMNQNMTARLQTLEGLCSKSTTPPMSVPNDVSLTALKQNPTPNVFSSFPDKSADSAPIVPTPRP